MNFRISTVLSTAICLVCNVLLMHAKNEPIAVNINESVTISLFFPSEIRQVVDPAENYSFDYQKEGRMGTITATKGSTSNLTVITANGSIFSFSLEYNKEVADFAYVLSAEQAIGNVTGINSERNTKNKGALAPKQVMTDISNNGVRNFKEVNKAEASSLYGLNRIDYITIFCENNYDQSPRLRKPPRSGEGVTLQLNSIISNNKERYFTFEIENNTTTAYEVNKLQFYVHSAKEDKTVVLQPIYVHKYQQNIVPAERSFIAYVFKDFEVASNKELFISMEELNGSGNVMLQLDAKTLKRATE